MAGSITDVSTEDAPAEQTVEICIVGSGSGGATAARALAEAGREVLVLEEGGDFLGERLTQRDSLYDQLYMDAGARATDDFSIAVLQGRVLGGGGVINASDVVPIHDAVLRCWEKKHSLADFAPEAVAPHQKRAREDLSASRIPDDLASRGNHILRRGADALGLRGEMMDHNRVGCIGLGKCLVGCPMNAKQNPRLVAIPKALAAGARFYTRARAVRLESTDRDLKTVHVRALDPDGVHERGELRIRAKVVVLAANAIATAQLLLRSGVGNEHVGRHLTLQPQLPVLAIFREPVDGYRGIPQAYAVTEYETESEETGLGGFRIEGIMGTPGIVAAGLPRSGLWAKEIMSRYAHLAMVLCLVPDQPSGRVEIAGSGAPVIRYEQRPDVHDRFRRAAKAAARIYLREGAERVVVPVARPVDIRAESDLSKVDSIDFSPASAPLLSAHQQGTVRFAPSPEKGGADPDGQVYGARDLYVFDSSGYPTSASSHTMAPIIATSYLLSAKLVAKLG